MSTTPQDDKALALELAKYLPEEIHVYTCRPFGGTAIEKSMKWLVYYDEGQIDQGATVLGTEYLAICHRIEEKMNLKQKAQYLLAIGYSFSGGEWHGNGELFFSTWQQRLRAIIQTLGNPEPKKGE